MAILAWIIPVEQSGGSPPGIWGPTDPRPTNPIYWPGFPGQPPSGGGGGGQPPGTWGGDSPWPGYATPPIYNPPGSSPPDRPRPTPPVAGWPSVPGGGGNYPGSPGFRPPGGGGGGEGNPPGIWGGANEPFPTPPIFIPPGLPPVQQPEGVIDWKTAWTPETGWIVVGIPQVPHPTPSGGVQPPAGAAAVKK